MHQKQKIKALKYYTSMGMSVIPLKGKHASNEKEYKVPLIPWTKYQTVHPNTTEIQKWIELWPLMNIGIVTGKISGIIVLDFDSIEALKFGKENKLFNTPLVKTGKGIHAYYKYPDNVNICNILKLNNLDIDIKSDGGYVVAPPSIHPSNIQYKWVEKKELWKIPLAPVPELILELIKQHQNLTTSNKSKNKITPLYKGVREGTRNTSLVKLLGSWLNDNLSYEECLSMSKLWNQKNNPPLGETEIERTVKSLYIKHHNKKSVQKNISYIEKNLLRFPICTRNRDLIHKPEKIEYIIKKETFEKKWLVLSNVNYGLPGPFDEDVLMAILNIASNKTKPLRNPLNIGPLSDIAKILKISSTGQNIQNIKTSIKRLKSITIVSEETFYDNKQKKFITDMFNIIDRVVFKGKIFNREIIEKGNFIWLNKIILDNLNANYTIPLDFNTYINLKSEIAKGLYKMLSFIFFANNKAPIQIYYSTITKEIQIKQMQSLSKIKEQLNQAIEELIAIKFLSNVKYNENTKILFSP